MSTMPLNEFDMRLAIFVKLSRLERQLLLLALLSVRFTNGALEVCNDLEAGREGLDSEAGGVYPDAEP